MANKWSAVIIIIIIICIVCVSKHSADDCTLQAMNGRHRLSFVCTHSHRRLRRALRCRSTQWPQIEFRCFRSLYTPLPSLSLPILYLPSFSIHRTQWNLSGYRTPRIHNDAAPIEAIYDRFCSIQSHALRCRVYLIAVKRAYNSIRCNNTLPAQYSSMDGVNREL